ncbi:hypothetical protein GCM10010968_07220 [Agrococcus terreus]|uniref:Asparagine synthase (Glutamine-hydrolysing) n=2 Tax=Agrococcus terreus TaxID=574649 RepID=A0ABQ2KD37_9MICO|nr:hypothetical protein GCM10010968_07220 [Agrococcus terreus]
MRMAGEAYDMHRAIVEKTERRAVVNARSLEETWQAPTWLEDEHGVLALSQPPVSFVTDVGQPAWSAWALATLRSDEGRRGVHPGYTGISLWRDGGMEMWCDVFGFSRNYIVQNHDFVAVGNHIGMVSLFSSDRLEVDQFGADVLSQVGFWPLNNSPIKSVRRLGPAEVVAIGMHDEVSRRSYATEEEFFGYGDPGPDLDSVAASLALSTSNAGALMVSVPTIHLSGGQDSRLTAAAWIAGGRPGRLSTVGNLQGETDVATSLVGALEAEKSLTARGLTHRITTTNPKRTATFSIEERLVAGLRQWDGDFAPGNLRAPIVRPPRKSVLTIGGGNGEIMHPMYYGNERILSLVRAMDHPVLRISKAFAPRYNVTRVAESTQGFLEDRAQFMRGIGQNDATALNVFQMMSKYRRWLNSQLTGTSFVLLANPLFVRAAMSLTPEQRLERFMQGEMARRLVPQWEGHAYYKASPGDFKQSDIVQDSRIWKTSPGSMERMLQDDEAWKMWFDESLMLALQEEVRSGNGATVHESTLSKAFVVNGLPSHVGALEGVRRGLWDH